MKFLSVIVPMYNVEPFVEKCLQRLVDQDIPIEDYEIICVNDGSPDNSRDIVLRFKEKYENIVLIDQENQGVSGARNNGIDRACGKYLMFIDPDDYVDRNTFKRALSIAEKEKTQVAYLGFAVLNEDESIKSTVYLEESAGKTFKGVDAYTVTHSKRKADPDRIYGILFNREFVETYNFRFLVGVPYLEDGELMTRMLSIADNCFFISGPFYRRTTRPGSATNSNLFYSKYAIDGFIKSAVNLREFSRKQDLNDTQREFLNQPIAKYVILTVSATARLTSFKTFLYVRSELRKNGFKKLNMDGSYKMYQKLGGLFNASIYMLYIYMLLRPLGLSYRKLKNKLLKV